MYLPSKALNLECPADYAIRQRSRGDLEASMDCPMPDKTEDVECINKLNELTLERAVNHS